MRASSNVIPISAHVAFFLAGVEAVGIWESIASGLGLVWGGHSRPDNRGLAMISVFHQAPALANLKAARVPRAIANTTGPAQTRRHGQVK